MAETKIWVIAKVGKKTVLFNTRIRAFSMRYLDEDRDTYEKEGVLHFTPTFSNERFDVNQFVMITSENKPSKELYDVEYGSKEWNSMCGNDQEFEPER